MDCLGGIKFITSHKILGIIFQRNLKFGEDVEQVIIKCRKLLSWIHIYRSKLSIKQKRLAYILYVQSFLDYHNNVIWPYLNQSQRFRLSRIPYRAARLLLRAPSTIDGEICCREAKILSPKHRFTWCTLLRARKLRPEHSLNHGSWLAYKHQVEQMGLNSLLVATDSLFKQQVEDLKQQFSDEQLQSYWNKYPERAKYLLHTGPKALNRDSQLAFVARTRQVKTKEWRSKHGQPLQQSISSLCRFCESVPETIEHLLISCPHPNILRQQQLLLMRLASVNPDCTQTLEGILTRHETPEISVVQNKALSKFFQYLNL
jgi:hypothetical protein